MPGNGFPAADLAIGFLNLAQNPGFCPETGPGTMLGFLAVRKAAECSGQIQNWTEFRPGALPNHWG